VESDDYQTGYLREWPANLDDFDEMKRRDVAEFIDQYHNVSEKHHELVGAVLDFIRVWNQRENRGVLEELELRLNIMESMVKSKGQT